MATSDRPRPSPDALLAQAASEGKGKLKIFLGAAPGVGKTYEMLQAAQLRRRAGQDVLVGVVETHGRAETAALLDGLEIQPRVQVDYKGRVLDEMDIDAILARRPDLVLVDELAHSNAPGSRHPKRYQDVEELIDAGIDVYSTLNIQHVVARITRVRVRETVPDRMIDTANEVEVIDLPPAELIERLNDGKVYVREQAQRAIKHYFQPGNLTALRELALRRTAERVDAQMVSYMRANAIAGPWGAGERVLVLVDESDAAPSLVRYAKRMAERLKASWSAVHFETGRDQSLTEADKRRIAESLRLAEHLGADVVTLPGERIANDILALAADTNVTHILLAKSKRPRWFELVFGSVVHEVIAKAQGISVHVISPDPTVATASKPPADASPAIDPRPYGIAALYVGATTALGMMIEAVISAPNISLVFLTAVLASAVRDGRWPGLFAAFLSMLSYNFFFLEPRYSLTIDDPANVLAFVFFSIVSVLASGLAARVRTQNLAARTLALRTAALYGFSRKIAGIADIYDLVWASAHQVATMLNVEVVFLIPDTHGTLSVAGGFPPEDNVDDADLAAAKWSFDRDAATGWGSETLPGANRLFLPLKTARTKVGVIGIRRADATKRLTPDEERLLDALADQTAVAIERITLAADVDAARVAAEGERLRAAILTSVSHDLKTPLAGILGAVTSLRQYADRFDATAREELMATVQDEAERMSRFVSNLLDMTKLDAGVLKPKQEVLDLADVIGAALNHVRRLLTQHKVIVDVQANLPMVILDFVLMEQVLINLLDNAAKFTPMGSEITIQARDVGSFVQVEIRDNGPGIAEASLSRLFDKFYRAEQGDKNNVGTGLGLAICKGFVEAMGGTIAARNAPVRGAVFTIKLPAKLIAHLTIEDERGQA
jgi:two-component system sensor histidine kinase KdpD